MKLKIQLTRLLENEPKARERRNKNRAVANLLLSNHPSIQGINKEVLTEIVTETLYLDRMWRKLLADERIDLRGTDYSGGNFKEKEQLEQESEISMGYVAGHNQKSVV